MSIYNCFTPSNFDVDSLLANYPPDKIEKFNRDILIYIAGLPSLIHATNSDLATTTGFVPVHARTLQCMVRNYKDYLNYLVNANVLESDRSYTISEKSTGFRYTSDFSTPVKQTPIYDQAFIRKLNKPNKANYSVRIRYPYLVKWFNPHLEIDVTNAESFSWERYKTERHDDHAKALHNLNRSLINIEKIRSQRYCLSVDNTVGRFHSNITLMKSSLRQFLTYNGAPLVTLDIANALPYFSTILFNPQFWLKPTQSELPITFYSIINRSTHQFNLNPDLLIMITNHIKRSDNQDCITFQNLVRTGSFYRHMQQQMKEHYNLDYSLKRIKKEMLITFNAGGKKAFKMRTLFSNLFPNIALMLDAIKSPDNSNLAHLLLNLESMIILNRIARKFSQLYPNAPIYTIHDSLLTTPDYEPYLAALIKEETTRHLNYAPHLKRE